MKAIQFSSFGGPEVLQLVDVPDPRPAEGQVLIAVRAADVNPVDAYIRSNQEGHAQEKPGLSAQVVEKRHTKASDGLAR